MSIMRIGVIGGGVVGHATARSFMEYAEVKVYDILPEKRTHNIGETIGGSDIVFICLPTPLREDGRLSTTYLEQFFESVASWRFQNFVIKSTVPVGTTRRLSKECNLPNLVHSPEFLTARTSVIDAQMPARNIIGSKTGLPEDYGRETNLDENPVALHNLYAKRFPGIPILHMSFECSELIKLAQNSFFATKIAFFNELHTYVTALGLDWDTILKGMISDGRIGHTHTQVPGPDGKFGYGGACLFPETPIATPFGHTEIGELEIGDRILDHKGETKVTAITKRKVSEYVSLKARGRKVTGSFDHIHIRAISDTFQEMILSDFKVGDWIFIPKQPLPEIHPSISMPMPVKYAKSWPDKISWTEDLAWIVGLWLADGHRGIYTNGQGRKGWTVGWSLGEVKTNQADKLFSILSDMGCTPSKSWKVSDGTYGPSETWCIRVRTAWFYHLLETIGVGHGAHGKRAPLVSANLARSLIGGWLDGDGSYYGGTISGHSENPDLIKDIDRLFLGLGICPQIGKDGKDIKVSEREKVEEVCGWTTRHKFDPSRYVRDFPYASPTLKSHPLGWIAQVQEVSFSAGGEVVAIETESGYYIANGHLTHNCLPKDLSEMVVAINEICQSSCYVMEAVYYRNEEHDRGREV